MLDTVKTNPVNYEIDINLKLELRVTHIFAKAYYPIICTSLVVSLKNWARPIGGPVE